MEIKKVFRNPTSPALKEKHEREKLHKQEATKSFGDYLISITNYCFDKCINPDSIYISKSEEKCVNNIFHKFSEAHHYALNKFEYINISTESDTLERANEYGDYYDLLQNVFREDIYNKTH